MITDPSGVCRALTFVKTSGCAVGHDSTLDPAYQFLRFCEVLPGEIYYQLVEPEFLYPEGELRQQGRHPGRSVQVHDVAERLLEPPGFLAEVLECLEQIGELGGIELLSLEGEPAVTTQGGAALYLSSHASASSSNVEGALKNAAKTPGTKSKDGRLILLENVGGF